MSPASIVRLALPNKGALETSTISFLAECGLKICRSNPRQYLAHIRSMPGLEVVFQRAADVPELVQNGDAALGITGYDILAEHRGYGEVGVEDEGYDGSPIVLVRDLGYGGCRLALAVPETWIDVSNCADLWHLSSYYQQHKHRGLRIATKYPRLTTEFLRHHTITHYKLLSPHGALEAAPLTDTADLIVDLTETGTTLRENRLKLLDDGTVLRSQSCLIGNLELLNKNAEALRLTETMLELIEARIQARNHSMLTAYFHGSNRDEMQRLCTRLNQRLKPVSSEVQFRVSINADTGWSTISGVVTMGQAAPELLETVGVLRGAGAVHINLTPLSYRFAEECLHVRALRERLKRFH
jgi:ATP phosphoribosyltransferase